MGKDSTLQKAGRVVRSDKGSPLRTPEELKAAGQLSNYAVKQLIETGALTPIVFGPRIIRFDGAQVDALLQRGVK